MLMTADQSSLLIVDVQEKLCPVMEDPRSVIHNCGRLMKGAARLGVPVLVSEQYPKGIGPTMVDLRELTDKENFLEKTTFSCAAAPNIMERLEALGRRKVVVAGIETHVCVCQTTLGLLENGYEVFVVADACSSRSPQDRKTGLERMQASGARIVPTESVLFEWLGDAKHEAFREIMQGLIK
jgi:nicotinamidase-related amidase